jgi:hypothetical protein
MQGPSRPGGLAARLGGSLLAGAAGGEGIAAP